MSVCHRIWTVALVMLWPTTGLAQSHSDLVIFIDEDGVGYTAQHTLFAHGELIVSRLPSGRETLHTVFSGPDSALYQRANEQSPDKFSLVAGGAFTRFRHRFDVEAQASRQAESIAASDSVEAAGATGPARHFRDTRKEQLRYQRLLRHLYLRPPLHSLIPPWPIQSHCCFASAGYYHPT